eukprot:1510337-Rhodomonas_salina.1
MQRFSTASGQTLSRSPWSGWGTKPSNAGYVPRMPPSGLGRAFATHSTCAPKRNTGCGLLQSAHASGEPGRRQWWR